MNFVLSERALEGGGELLSIEGTTTSAAADRIRKRVDEIAHRGKRTVIVDLSRVSFVDSAVVQALGDAAAASKKRGGRLLVVEPVDPMVARPLEMGRLDLVAEVLPTLDQAAEAMRLPPGSLQPAIPPPAPPPEEPARTRRTLFGRRHTDQEILRELGELRRLAQELRRETGMYQRVSSEETERRRAAEAALLLAREVETRPAEPQAADELADARRELEEARARAEQARAEADRMEAEAEAAHARIQALEAHMQTAREQTAALQRELDHARARVTTAEREAERMEVEAEDAHARIQALEAENAELRAALEQARASHAIAEAEADQRAAAERDEQARRAATAEAERVRAEEEARRREAEDAQRRAEAARLQAEERERAEAADRERREADARAQREAENREAELRAQREAEDREAEQRARREAEERAAREAEEGRRLAEEEAARGPRPKVPVWSNPSPIDLNTADIDELMLLPGIGRRPAERILEARDANGGFQTVDDLYEIAGIPKDRVIRIRPYVRV